MSFILALSLPDRNVYTALAADTKDVATASPTDTCYETDTGDLYQFNGAEWKKIGTTISDGSAAGLMVFGANAALSGAEQIRHMVATLDSGTPVGQADILDDSTGFKVFTVTIDPITTLAAGESIVVAYGIVSGDTNVETNAKNASVELSGTRTGQAYTDIVVLNANNPSATIIYDYTNTIKRIVAITSDAADRSVTITTVG